MRLIRATPPLSVVPAALTLCLLAAPLPASAATRRPAPPPPPSTAFRIAVAEEGVYRVSFEDLASAGLKARSLASRRLGLFNRGEAVPIWVRDGGDGLFGAGDWLEFVGERLPGETAHFNEYTNLNTYVLRTGVTAPARMRAVRKPAGADAQAAPLTARVHQEQDLLLLRLTGQAARKEELWYWAKLSHIDPEPFRQAFDLSDLDRTSSRPVLVRLELRGWSQPATRPGPEMKDHRVEVSVAGKVVKGTEWNNAEGTQLIELPPLPASSLAAGPVEVSVRVPARATEKDTLVDVVVLNWVEVEYPRMGRLQQAQTRLYSDEPGAVRLLAASREPIVIYGEDGTRVDPSAVVFETRADHTRVLGPLLQAKRLDVVVGGQLRPPQSVILDQPSNLASKKHRADYIMVVHERLRDAIRPLADFHRGRGLKVEVVDIQDVYDEFNHGIQHPRALRDFLSHAYHSWAQPAPRFVLLVGDASWDAKNEQHDDAQYPAASYSPAHGTNFANVPATHYGAGTELRNRNLIPTWSYLTYDGHAAGDNWFVSVDGEDDLPDMAVGRFPVTEPADVAGIVEKTIRYQQAPEYGPWRNRMLWITSEQAGFISMSDQLADAFAKRGFAPDKVYPPPDAAAGTHDQQRLRDALDQGDLLVHFVGHGGRFIWRTGPPDWQKHRDLFNLDDIDKLQATNRLPVIVSMTCYSAPFDHPSADSIGEKFLRVPGKGAVAVIAASWRNAPYRNMSEDLYRELTEGGQTVGEAVQKVKRKNYHREFLEQYNLLGDPALVLATPRLKIEVEPYMAADGPPTVRATVSAEGFAGRAVVDWVDAKGEVTGRQIVDVKGPRFTAALTAAPGWTAPAPAGARIYAWDPNSGMDGFGHISFTPPASASLPAPAPVTP